MESNPTLCAADFIAPAQPGGAAFDDGMTESGSESDFIRWLFDHAPTVVRWLMPQPGLDVLVGSTGARRCDFLFAVPGSRPAVIEIDGRQHLEQREEDTGRDAQLSEAGIETIRVPTSELEQGSGAGLDAVIALGQHIPSPLPNHVEPLVWIPVQLHRLVLALCEALDAGWLAGDCWRIEVRDPTGRAVDLVGPYLGLFDALDCMWGDRSTAPGSVVFRCGSRFVGYRRTAVGSYESAAVDEASCDEFDARLMLDCDRTSSEPLPERRADPTVVIRSTGMSVMYMSEDPRVEARSEPFAACSDEGERRASLIAVLRAVFAKRDLLEGQFEAISQVLEGGDCAVLLPTGAGKSMIYQLSGLCMPGRTLIVDPLVALMEDQVLSLRSAGIDRVRAISSITASQRFDAEDAYFTFVTPERLQRQQFRNELREAAETTSVGLVVIDEAHCVSEWGHDFRPAYLNFGDTVRRCCEGVLGVPALLALTGTASRVVLKDVLFQLGIKQEHEYSVVRPSSFDRPELAYRVVRTAPAEAQATLRGILRSMPSQFGEIGALFFEPTQSLDTNSGIVFVPTAGAKGWHNVTETWEAVREQIPTAVRYSGRAPAGFNDGDWSNLKRTFVDRFKSNRAAAIVTTKAFGMGIDMPNVRWVVHFGLPGSIEAYYQEVGRAGRDRRSSQCVYVLTEHDAERNRRRLDARRLGDSLPTAYSERDDVGTALYFHETSFPPREDELQCLLQVFRVLDSGDRRLPLVKVAGKPDAGKRALHRLAVLNVVSDYCLEGRESSEVAVVTTRDATAEDVRIGLLDFVGRSDPSRRHAIDSGIDTGSGLLLDAVNHCGHMLIDLIYETIEGARRRSLREMWLAAQDAVDDGEVMRERLLGYLTEGDIAQHVQQLAERERFEWSDWIDAWANLPAVGMDGRPTESEELTAAEVAGLFVSETDTRDWRSAAARLLASYPDHPGLLATRGLAEALLPGGNLAEYERHIVRCLERAGDSYRADEKDTEDFILWALDLLLGATGADEASGAARITLAAQVPEPSALAAAIVGAAEQVGLMTEALQRRLRHNWHTDVQLAILQLAIAAEGASDMAAMAQGRFEMC